MWVQEKKREREGETGRLKEKKKETEKRKMENVYFIFNYIYFLTSFFNCTKVVSHCLFLCGIVSCHWTKWAWGLYD